MLGSHKIMAFAPPSTPTRPGPFMKASSACVSSARTISLSRSMPTASSLRVTNVPPAFKPQQFTILGWQVPDVAKAVSALKPKGVQFESYGLPTAGCRGHLDRPRWR